ncbi:MAG TPA: hypothetical protein VH478_15170 [Trebonia sp.]|jgi:O-antigen/teichoic acid export membrane protein|nr:hypothetical protein [Trebonia sp.]
MVPTLAGRVQTRLFVLASAGAIVTAVITPFIGIASSPGGAYEAAYAILATIAVIGIIWELIYHLLMQWRWEKDWPALFGLVSGAWEGAAVWLLLAAHVVPGISTTPPLPAYLLDFIVVWLCAWLATQGPMRVPFIRWRFRGGRLV